MATLLIGVIPRLWRRRSAGFHVRDRSLLTFCRSVTGCCPRVGGREGAFRNSDSTKYVFCKKSARCVSLDSAEFGVECPDGQNAQLRGHLPRPGARVGDWSPFWRTWRRWIKSSNEIWRTHRPQGLQIGELGLPSCSARHDRRWRSHLLPSTACPDHRVRVGVSMKRLKILVSPAMSRSEVS